MNYSDTKTLYPDGEKSVGFDKESLEQLKNINERLDNMSNDIADINDKVDGLDTQVVTENLQASQASLQEVSANELNAQSASISELEAGNATANKVISRGQIKGAQLEITGTSHLKDDVTVDGKVTSESVRAGSVTTDHLIADEMDVTDFTVDELSVTEKATIKEEEVETSVVTTQTVSSQTVESQEVTSQNVVSQDVTSQEVTNQDVENAVIEDAEIKALTSGGNTFNFNSDNSIAITEDSYIRIKPEINSEVRLILKTALNATILAAAVSVDVPAADKANVHLVYSNTEALSDIYFDVNGNLWLKLETGVRGTLYFMQGGINTVTPETDSVVNPAFDPTAEGTIHYESGTHGDIYITSKVIFNSEVQINKDVEFKKGVEVGGNMHIEGNLDVDGNITIGGLSAERAQYLGNSDNVTADDDGNFSAKDGTFDGDVAAVNVHATNDLSVDGAASVGGTLNVTDDITTAGDIESDNLTTSNNANIGGDATINGDASVDGDLDVDGTINGDLTGDVTGNLTGNVTGDVTGDLTGTADKAISDKDGNDIKTTYATKSEIPDVKAVVEKMLPGRGYSYIVDASNPVHAAAIVSILQTGSFTESGETVSVGSNPLFVGAFNITQDINLYDFDSVNGLGSSLIKPETMYPDKPFNSDFTQGTIFKFNNHKLTLPSTRIGFTNLCMNGAVFAITSGWAVCYVDVYCCLFQNISTDSVTNKEIYFQLDNSSFIDSGASYDDGHRYFSKCKNSVITLINKDDTVSQVTGLLDCDDCNITLTLDKNPGAGENQFTSCPCIIDGLFNCTINYNARHLYAQDSFQCGKGGDFNLTFFTKTRPYFAKNCSFFIDYKNISDSLPSGTTANKNNLRYVFNIMLTSSISSYLDAYDSAETIADCLIKVRNNNTLCSEKALIGYVSNNGVINFNRNKVFLLGNWTNSGRSYVEVLFGIGTFFGIKDNDIFLALTNNINPKLFGTVYTTLFGFVGNNFYHKKNSGESTVDPWSWTWMSAVAPRIYAVLPPSVDLSNFNMADISGGTYVFASSAKYTFWAGNNSFDSF